MITDIPKNRHRNMKTVSIWRIVFVFFLGVLCFLVSQVFTRVPLLAWLQKQPGFMLWVMSFPLLGSVLVGMSAGVFEESGRFVFKALAIRPARSRIWEPIVFGLGHGLCEAVWLFTTAWTTLSSMDPSQLILPVVERLLAITIHVGFSVMIWNGFQLDERWRYLVFAILAHGLVDTLIPLAGKFGWGVLQLEGMVAGVAALLLVYVFYSRKYYLKEDAYV